MVDFNKLARDMERNRDKDFICPICLEAWCWKPELLPNGKINAICGVCGISTGPYKNEYELEDDWEVCYDSRVGKKLRILEKLFNEDRFMTASNFVDIDVPDVSDHMRHLLVPELIEMSKMIINCSWQDCWMITPKGRRFISQSHVRKYVERCSVR